ncbi:MAG: class I SAM-dependent DNA methyltransferase [Candidatus Heimdallarchaeota archaeon]
MKKPPNTDFISIFQRIITNFENLRFKEKGMKQSYGIVYTPKELVEFIVDNVFKIYFIELFQKFNIPTKKCEEFSTVIYNNRHIFKDKIESIKILDPASGSGRFLISIAKYLFKLYKLLNSDESYFELKKKIIENNLYGVEIDNSAYFISKIRLLDWLYSNEEKYHNIKDRFDNFLEIHDKEAIIDILGIRFNIFNMDFLLEFNENIFNIIVGNPPYVENKKIRDSNYKNQLSRRFESAYRLYDLSILFIEKAIELLKDKEGILSFIMPNKFLAADYGVKIRNLLLNKTKLKELTNISSFPIFSNSATYPVIITLKKEKPDTSNDFFIREINKMDDFINHSKNKRKTISQDLIKIFPKNVIPIKPNLEFVNKLFINYKPFSEVISDMKLLYRPFGFINWAKNLNNISQTKHSYRDLILLGTGNVGKYFIQFKKRIKIAKNDIKVSYFKYTPNFENQWSDLNSEKLIFREIAKESTWVYDPGIFTNVTGLYFVKIPSFNTDKLFCLLAIMNSKILDITFKVLYGSLHMSGGYLRFNGSFIKSLPIPEKFPESLSKISKILQFLSQLKYELSFNSNSLYLKEFDISQIERLFNFYNNLCNALINQLYLKDQEFKELDIFLNSKNFFPSIKTKYFEPLYKLPKYKVYEKEEIYNILDKVENVLANLNLNKELMEMIKKRQIN